MPANDRIRLRRNPPNVAVPQGYDDLYFNSAGELVHESADGTSETVGSGAEVTVDNETVNAAIAEDPAASRAALEVSDSSVLSQINVTTAPYSAVADAKFGDGAVMTSGSAVLTLSGANFAASGLTGKFIRVVGAGTAGADLVTTIASRDSTTQLTLSANAATSVSSAQIFYGTDNTTAIQSAIDAALASDQRPTVFIPAGKYLCNVLSYPTIKIKGAGTLAGQSAYNSINLAAETKCTYLLPALATSAVIRFNNSNYSGGAVISDMVLVGGDGTTSSDRKGTGIEIGETLDSINGPMPGSWRIERVELNGFNRGLTMSRTWDSVVEGVTVNYCNVGFFGGELDSGGVAKTTGPADGISFIGCNSNYAATVFALHGCKQTSIICGDFNHMEKLALLEESFLFVSGVNVETCSSVMFHLYGANSSRLDAAYITGLNWTGDFIWNDSTSTNHSVSVRASTGASLVYKTPAVSGYPMDLPRTSILKRYVDSTYATLKQTEYWDNIARVNWERENLMVLRENWTKAAASPYGANGWTGTAISGSTTYGAQSNSFYIYQASGSQAARFMPENDVFQFYTNWQMKWVFKLMSNPTATAMRVGLYSRDGTAAMIPANGIGLRADSVTAGDTNAQLEVIVGGVIQTTVDTGIALSALDDVYYEMVINKQGSNCHLHLRNLNSNALAANQVTYSSTFPATTTYAAPGFFLSGSASQLVYMRPVFFEQLQ